jgi:hypothetical protein
LENYLQQEKDDHNSQLDEVAKAAAASSMSVLHYEDLTQKQQEAARSLPNGIYVEHIMLKMSKIRLLRSAS